MWYICVACPLLAGCFGYVYPDISRTPAVAVPAADVHAFRAVSEFETSGPGSSRTVQVGKTLNEIPVVNGTVGPERGAYLSYHCLLFPIFCGSNFRTLNILLYRPGYEVVEIPADRLWCTGGLDAPEAVAWKEAPDLTAQRNAVDRLVSLGSSGSSSQDVLRFAAAEYARLADSPMATAAMRGELLRQAADCREWADAKAP